MKCDVSILSALGVSRLSNNFQTLDYLCTLLVRMASLWYAEQIILCERCTGLSYKTHYVFMYREERGKRRTAITSD
jgi:hypothetical protein